MAKIKQQKRASKQLLKSEPIESDVHKTTTQRRKDKREIWSQKLTKQYEKPLKTEAPSILNLTQLTSTLTQITTSEATSFEKTLPKKLNSTSKVDLIIPKAAKSQNAKRKQNIEEMTRLRQVTQLAVFKQNPLATIQQHLKNTIQCLPQPSE